MAIISSRPSLGLIRTRWRKKGARTLAERAGVMGANVWKIATQVYRHMEKEGFRFGSDGQVTVVIGEMIAFLVQLADRLLYGRLPEADRAALVSDLVRHLAHTMENNQLDLLGPGEYRKPFIDLFNARSAEYASFDYAGGEPDYACLRYFAGRVAEAMAASDDKWVVEQIMEIEAPEMVRVMTRLVNETDASPG